jgi:DNA-binding transcriptional regulator YbjK
VLADAAIAILASRGIHQLTHRNVDQHAGLPVGTAANYFPQRDELLAAAAHRIVELHLAGMAAATGAPPSRPLSRSDLANLIGDSLYVAATEYRDRYLAIYELLLEATRRPFLMQTLSTISAATLESTLALHRYLGLSTTRAQVQDMTTLYGGALFTLITAMPSATITRRRARSLVRHIVTGVLGTD